MVRPLNNLKPVSSTLYDTPNFTFYHLSNNLCLSLLILKANIKSIPHFTISSQMTIQGTRSLRDHLQNLLDLKIYKVNRKRPLGLFSSKMVKSM